ncbi:MAG: lysylphosphatidylglycerol synthase domain-containing protein [Minicystis sp.]
MSSDRREGPASPPRSRWRALRLVIWIGLSASACAALARYVDLRGVVAALRRAPIFPHVVALGLGVTASTLARAHRWKLLLDDTGSRISFADAARVRMGTAPLALVLPLKIGDGARCAALRGLGVPVATTLGTLLAEKLLVLAAAAALVLVAAPLASSTLPLVAPAAAIFIGSLLPFFPGPWHGLARRLGARLGAPRFVDRLLAFGAVPLRRTLVLLAYSIALRVADVVLLGVALAAVGVMPPATAILQAGAFSGFVSLVPLTVGNVGPREGVLIAALAAHAPADALLAASVIATAALHFLPALLGIPLLPSLWRLEAKAAPQDG